MSMALTYPIAPTDTPKDHSLLHHYQQVRNSLRSHPAFDWHDRSMAPPQPTDQPITPKMRAKLLLWLERLALNTFHFSRNTLTTATVLLDLHLINTNESPYDLQLLGCVVLLIASKLTESNIVAPECYLTASCNIFTLEKLLQKQREVFDQIQWQQIRSGPAKGVRLGCMQLKLKHKLPLAEKILFTLIKDQELKSIGSSKLACMSLALLKMTLEENISQQQWVELAKSL